MNDMSTMPARARQAYWILFWIRISFFNHFAHVFVCNVRSSRARAKRWQYHTSKGSKATTTAHTLFGQYNSIHTLRTFTLCLLHAFVQGVVCNLHGTKSVLSFYRTIHEFGIFRLKSTYFSALTRTKTFVLRFEF